MTTCVRSPTSCVTRRSRRSLLTSALLMGRLKIEDAIYSSNEYRKTGDRRDLEWAQHCTEMATRHFAHAAMCRRMMKDRLYAARTGCLERPRAA